MFILLEKTHCKRGLAYGIEHRLRYSSSGVLRRSRSIWEIKDTGDWNSFSLID